MILIRSLQKHVRLLQEFQDIVDRFGNPDYEQNFSDYTFFIILEIE